MVKNVGAARLLAATKIFAVTALVLGLSACGWHLRGQVSLPESMRHVHLQADTISTTQRRDIEFAFTLNKVNLVPLSEAAYTVQLFGIEKERRADSLGTDAVADSIALSLTADYAIADQQGIVVIPRGPARVSRSFNFDRDNLAAKNQEEQIIERELRQELAQQILRSFRYALRNRSEAPSSTPEIVPRVHEQLDEQTTPGATD